MSLILVIQVSLDFVHLHAMQTLITLNSQRKRNFVYHDHSRNVLQLETGIIKRGIEGTIIRQKRASE